MLPRINGVVEHSCIAISAISVIGCRRPPHGIVIVLVLVIVCIAAESRIECVDNSSLVRRRAAKVVLVRHRCNDISRLPVTYAIEVGCSRVQFRRNLVNGCLGDGDTLRLGVAVTKFLSTDLAQAKK
jgi:hypothetical protein